MVNQISISNPVIHEYEGKHTYCQSQDLEQSPSSEGGVEWEVLQAWTWEEEL